jgi:hypothetical protein
VFRIENDRLHVDMYRVIDPEGRTLKTAIKRFVRHLCAAPVELPQTHAALPVRRFQVQAFKQLA